MQDVGQGRTQYVGHAGELFGKHVGSGLVLGSAGCKGLQTHVEGAEAENPAAKEKQSCHSSSFGSACATNLS